MWGGEGNLEDGVKTRTSQMGAEGRDALERLLGSCEPASPWGWVGSSGSRWA